MELSEQQPSPSGHNESGGLKPLLNALGDLHDLDIRLKWLRKASKAGIYSGSMKQLKRERKKSLKLAAKAMRKSPIFRSLKTRR
jgi:hypothetical protein